MKLKFLAAIGFAAILYSCDDTTTGIGDFVAENDGIEAFSDSYDISTRTILLDSIFSRTSSAYLGRFTDPEYGTFSAEFLTQINCPEGYEFPSTLQAIEEATLVMYYNSYYGDSLATMRVQVDTLNQVINDDGSDKRLYYTSLDPTAYYDKNKPALAQKYYAAHNHTMSDSLRNAVGYSSITLDLGEGFSNHLYEKYMENNHQNFKDAQAFINNVLKGFYIHTNQGEGSILYISDIKLLMKIRYTTKNSAGTADSIVRGYIPFPTTKEVFMSTRFDNDKSVLKQLAAEKEHTYLKTPAGLCTEITLPLEELYNDHKTDTLNSVSLTFTRLRETTERTYPMGIPGTLLLIRKSEVKDFFEGGKLYDNQTTFCADYTSNSYTFSKLNRLISHIFTEIENNPDTYNQDPDWNKILLIPVKKELDGSNSSTATVIGVSNDMEVNSARLIGGEEGEKIQMNVIYTQPKNPK